MNALKNIGILLLLVAPFYLWNIYESFFEEQPGYVYDPASDQLYWLTLRPSIYRFEHWKRHLLPFSSPRFNEIGYVERQASLTEELAHQHLPLDQQIEAIERETREIMQGIQEGKEPEFVDADYWRRTDLDPRTMLPVAWHRLPEELNDFDRSVIPADVVIARYSLRSKGPIDLQILRGVLFLNYDATLKVNSYCFHSSEFQWEACAK